MSHWKKFMDKDFLGAHDLDGRDVNVMIVDVTGGEIANGTKKNKKPVATLASMKGKRLEKKLALNSTNCKTLEQLAGSPDVEQWRSLAIVLFATTTQFGGQTVDCIRIRPYGPKKQSAGSSATETELSESDASDVPADSGAAHA